MRRWSEQAVRNRDQRKADKLVQRFVIRKLLERSIHAFKLVMLRNQKF